MSVNWEGGWVGSTSSSISYYTGDIINHNNIVYTVKKSVAIVPIGSPSPDLDMSNWDVFASGANGTSGSSGNSGTSGANGTSGSSGNSGTSGSSGNSGTNGSSGTSGTSGVNGTSGSSGSNGTSGSSGSSGSSGTNGTTGSSGSSGSSGVNVSASYLRGSRSTQQTSGLSANSLVVFTQTDNSTGSDISLNTGTGQITLAANRTYRLMAQIPTLTSSSINSRPSFCWYNETSSSWIGSLSAIYSPNDGAGFGSSMGMSEALITTTGTTVVSYRIVGAGSLTGLGGSSDFSTTGSYPWFDIEVVSGHSPLVNGTSGTTGAYVLNWNQAGGGTKVTLSASGSPQNIVSTTITTTGNPVRVTVYGDAENSGAGYWTKLQLYRNSTPIGAIVHTEGSAASENSPFALSHIDSVSAGTYTYYLKAIEISGGNVSFGESVQPIINVEELNGPGTSGTSGTTPTGIVNIASGLVNAGTDVTLGNLKARIPTSGNRSLQISTVTGTYSVYGSGVYSLIGSVAGSTIDSSSPISVTTTPKYLNSVYNFGSAGATDTWVIMDTGQSISWRITMILGLSYNNNMISIERLV